MKKPAVLFVDTETEFLEKMSAGPAGLVDIQVALERRSAQLKIADKNAFLSAICINTGICEPFSIPLVRFAKAHRPATPLYLVADKEDLVPDQALLEELHVVKCFRKPVDKTALFNAIFPYTYFDLEKALGLAAKDGSQVNAAVSADDGEMHAISAKDFLCGTRSYFDVFVRLGEGRYVKVLRAGDEFDSVRVRGYIEKGVTHFFLRKEAQEFFLQFCDKLTEAILSKKQTSPDLKMGQVKNFGQETMDFLLSRGFNEMTLQTAQQFVKHARLLTEDLKPQKNPILKAYLENVALCDHGTGTAMLLSLFLEELGYRDPKVIDVIGLSGFLHDIGLLSMPPHFLDEDTDKLKEDELAFYETHPIVGATALKGIRLLNPLVPQVVQQHHERRSRRGFPHKLGAGSISPVSELVGMADTLNQLVKRTASDRNLDPVAEMERKHFDDFSFQVIEAFRRLFLNKGRGDRTG